MDFEESYQVLYYHRPKFAKVSFQLETVSIVSLNLEIFEFAHPPIVQTFWVTTIANIFG
jgi:hypothetical protein